MYPRTSAFVRTNSRRSRPTRSRMRCRTCIGSTPRRHVHAEQRRGVVLPALPIDRPVHEDRALLIGLVACRRRRSAAAPAPKGSAARSTGPAGAPAGRTRLSEMMYPLPFDASGYMPPGTSASTGRRARRSSPSMSTATSITAVFPSISRSAAHGLNLVHPLDLPAARPQSADGNRNVRIAMSCDGITKRSGFSAVVHPVDDRRRSWPAPCRRGQRPAPATASARRRCADVRRGD